MSAILTKQEIKTKFKCNGTVHELTIPAGTLVRPTTGGRYFVEDISFLDRDSQAYRDANYVGIKLDPNQVHGDGERS